MASWKEEYDRAVELLTEKNVPEAELNVWYLLENVTGMTRTRFLLERNLEIRNPEEAGVPEFRRLVSERAKRIPLSYLIGNRMFMGLEFHVNDAVLIPRQDTECLVEEVLRISAGADILDMCTGSGCIAVSLAVLGHPASVTGVDISEKALEVAEANGRRLLAEAAERSAASKPDGAAERSGASQPDGVQNTPEQTDDVCDAAMKPEAAMGGEPRLRFLHSNLFEKVQGRYDIIVSNPPYIRSSVIETLEPEVRVHEPRLALDGEEDGLAFYRKITEAAPHFLKPGGQLFYEIGHDQGEEVSALLREHGFDEIRVIKDLAGLDRIVTGILVEEEYV